MPSGFGNSAESWNQPPMDTNGWLYRKFKENVYYEKTGGLQNSHTKIVFILVFTDFLKCLCIFQAKFKIIPLSYQPVLSLAHVKPMESF